MTYTSRLRIAIVVAIALMALVTIGAGTPRDATVITEEVQAAIESRLRYELAVNFYTLETSEVVQANGVVAGIAAVRHPSDPSSIHNFEIPFAVKLDSLERSWNVALPGEPEFQTYLNLLPPEVADGFERVTPSSAISIQASTGHYYLPYPKSLSYRVTSDFDDNRCDPPAYCAHAAIDFGLNEGNAVVAAMDGEVVDLKRSSTVCCGNSSCGNDANFIKLWHASVGEYSAYLHFKPDTIPSGIAIGTRVQRGTKIGEAGHSGWTWPSCAGNHLHFHVISGGAKVNPYFVEKPGVVYTGDNLVSQNEPSCCGCSAALAAADAPPLGGELIGPPAPEPPAVAFDLTAPGDATPAQPAPERIGEPALDTSPPALAVAADDAPWVTTAAPPAITWPAATDDQSGVAGYRVYWGPDAEGTTDMLLAEPAYAPAMPNTSSGAAIYYLRVAPLDKAGNLGDWRTVKVWRYDALAPTGTVAVSGGEVVPMLPVTLRLAAADDHSGVVAMRFSRDGANWSDWEPYAEARGWQLADVDGPQPIFAEFRDAAGNVSAVATTAVTRDLITAPPASANYHIVRSVMGMGGGPKASANYKLVGTSGQAFQTGVRQSASYRLSSGYWAAAPNAPNQPPNAPASPNPVHLATGVAATAALSWSGSDPDNDPLNYAVRFGTANPPPQVIPSQSAATYDPPDNLAYSTTYYWQIVASDGRGGTTAGPVWSFTTQATPNQPPNAPSSPNPANTATNVAATAALSWSGSDPDNDPLTYAVRFGTANPPPQVVASQSAASYDPPGNLANSTTYYWQIVASDGRGGTTAGPVWAFATVAAPVTFPNVFFISPTTLATIGGIPSQPADILRYTRSTNTWQMVYDGSARGTLKNIGAFAMLDDGSLLLVFSANQVITGLGTATPRDIVQFTPNTPNDFPLGPGTYSFFLRGQWPTVGLTTTGENIDALDVVPVPGGEYRVLISTTGAAAVPLPGGTVLKAADEDILVYDKNAPPHWESALAIDGSLMPGMAVEDINGVWDDPQSGDYYITILGAFNLGGVKGNGKTLIKLTPNALASKFTPSPVPWLAPGATFPSNLDAVDLLR